MNLQLTGELEGMEKTIMKSPEDAKKIVIRGRETLDHAKTFLISIKEMRKEVAEAFDPIIKDALASHRTAIAQKKKYELPLIEAEKVMKGSIKDYFDELAEQSRLAEEKAKIEAALLKARQDEQLKKAEEAMENGDAQKALEVINEEIPTPEASFPIETKPEMEGVYTRKIIKWRLADETLVPREFLMPDPLRISGEIKIHKENTNIPGIEVYAESTVAVKG